MELRALCIQCSPGSLDSEFVNTCIFYYCSAKCVISQYDCDHILTGKPRYRLIVIIYLRGRLDTG